MDELIPQGTAKTTLNNEDDKKWVAAAVAKFREDFSNRGFSARHPELGKMFNCPICQLRHRSSQVCQQVFTTGTHDPAPEGEKKVLVAAQTRKGILGAAMFAKKRLKPHHSHRLLRLVQLTQDLFPKYHPDQINDPEKAMKAARGEALQTLRRRYRGFRKDLLARQHTSRQINRGL
jgi:hypothetical protein